MTHIRFSLSRKHQNPLGTDAFNYFISTENLLRRLSEKTLVLLLCLSLFGATVLAQGNQFQVRYVGGSVPSTVKADDWGNTIIVSSDQILLKLKDGQEIKIDPKDARLITHSRNANRRIGTYTALAIVVNPLFAFGMLRENKQHFVGCG